MGTNPYDNTYSAFGGRWQRADACCGRVGSVFAPADAQMASAEEIIESSGLPGNTVLVPSDSDGDDDGGQE